MCVCVCVCVCVYNSSLCLSQYGIKKREEKEAELAAEAEAAAEGSLTRAKKAVPAGCGDDEEEDAGLMETVMKFLPGPLNNVLDMFNKK